MVWAAHREELVTQAQDTFEEFEQKNPEKSYSDRVEVMGIAGVRARVSANSNIKLIVIDEAHHAAPNNIQYGPLMCCTSNTLTSLSCPMT